MKLNDLNLNTSHVKVKRQRGLISKSKVTNLNTSHVKVKHFTNIFHKVDGLFKYISC